METSTNQTEAEKTNFVTLQIDYPTCYKLQMALDNVLNYPWPEPIPNYHELYRLKCDLYHVIMTVLQGSSVIDIQPVPIFEQVETDSDSPF